MPVQLGSDEPKSACSPKATATVSPRTCLDPDKPLGKMNREVTLEIDLGHMASLKAASRVAETYQRKT